ncbi:MULTISPECIES: DUF5665 domain-containing protein [unclassified Roseovarius]|jgi:Fe2+ transport system protein B|uniref:DUF5665 domain-containing protein n=1 Tax=unclassified Roseovarius TaxID=2614913 RepID=UPI0000685AF0|nr:MULTISPECIES: DUF5665 domain-containing protein [unclassified Roseovarius]EAQ27161.1 hypothetical protein ROS217_21582 [Roseovarius sp. 217]KJS43799.1 MAG: hypothetical protein VR71_09020 [Roseovarius sp. BRH_c41]
MSEDTGPSDDLMREVAALRRELQTLNAHRFIRVHNSFPRMLAFNLARGLAAGLGTVLGATVLISVMIWMLSQIEFLPIIGEWAAQIAAQVRDMQN